MHGNILLCDPVILPSQVIQLLDVTSVNAFHMQGDILQCQLVIFFLASNTTL